MVGKRLVLLALLLAPLPAAAREVSVAVGLSLPPYVLEAEQRGMELDIVREVLALKGHTLRPVFLPFARVVTEMARGGVDAAITINPESGVEACYSDSHIVYRNYAMTLADSGLKIASIGDLADKSVISFQNSRAYLGPEFKAAVDGNPQFREEAVQATQAVLLYSRRIQVVVADKNIFNWYSQSPEVKAKVDTSQPVAYHEIFPPTRYMVAFRDRGMCDEFNQALKALKASGAYAAIVARYGEQ